MDQKTSEAEPLKRSAAILGFWIFLAAGLFGYLAGQAVVELREYERTVTVKGLAEREVPADVVLWPIGFTAAANELPALYEELERQTSAIRDFLGEHQINASEITTSPPAVTDKLAQQYGNTTQMAFRYVANQSVTVYSTDVPRVRAAIQRLSELGQSGIALSSAGYGGGIEYLFNGLNTVKPQMVEEATRQAREVAEKFAADSQSQLGRIKRAQQGQFSIRDRDKNNPHLKRVRVVSTIEYYLAD